MVIPKAYIGSKLTDWERSGPLSPWGTLGPPIKSCDLLLVGDPGSGKTRCLYACAEAWRLNTIVVKAEAMVSQFSMAQSFKAEMTAEDLMATWVEAPLLCIDDIGASRTNEFATATLLRVISEREERALPTIVTTNLGKDDFEPRLKSRLSGYRVCKFPAIDHRKKRGGEVEEAAKRPPEMPHREKVERWLAMSHEQRKAIVADAQRNDPEYWRSYAVPGRCVEPMSDRDRGDCAQFATCIVLTMETAEKEPE